MQPRMTFAEFFTATNAVLESHGREPCGAPELLAGWEDGLSPEQAADYAMAAELLAGTHPLLH